MQEAEFPNLHSRTVGLAPPPGDLFRRLRIVSLDVTYTPVSGEAGSVHWVICQAQLRPRDGRRPRTP